jgi:ABC-2 type transport system permease protein
MNAFLIIWRREMSACFLAPQAYIALAVFLFMTGLTFFSEVVSNAGEPVSLNSLLFSSILLWLTILVTVISMRLFAEEKRSGTLETLLTLPVTDEAVVLGKYVAAVTFMAIAVLPAFCLPCILMMMSPGIQALEWGGMICGSGAILLLGAMFMALGIVVSLVTGSQIGASILTFCIIWLVLLGGWLISFIPYVPLGVVDYLSITNHLEEFSRGTVDSRPLVLYVSLTVFLLFAGIRILESRHWKK